MSIINPKLAAVFANDSQQTKFIAAALEQILGEEKTETLISEIMPQEAKAAVKFKGKPLVLFNGLDRAQMKAFHGLTDAEIDEVAALMGVHLDEEGESDAAVAQAAVESAGTATEKLADGTLTEPHDAAKVQEGTSEEVVDSTAGQADKTATVAAKQTQAKGNQAKGK